MSLKVEGGWLENDADVQAVWDGVRRLHDAFDVPWAEAARWYKVGYLKPGDPITLERVLAIHMGIATLRSLAKYEERRKAGGHGHN